MNGKCLRSAISVGIVILLLTIVVWSAYAFGIELVSWIAGILAVTGSTLGFMLRRLRLPGSAAPAGAEFSAAADPPVLASPKPVTAPPASEQSPTSQPRPLPSVRLVGSSTKWSREFLMTLEHETHHVRLKLEWPRGFVVEVDGAEVERNDSIQIPDETDFTLSDGTVARSIKVQSLQSRWVSAVVPLHTAALYASRHVGLVAIHIDGILIYAG
jgi:hypothetical protein